MIYLSKMMSNAKNIEIGRYFGIKGSTVSEALKGVETRIKRDKKFQKEIKILKGQQVRSLLRQKPSFDSAKAQLSCVRMTSH